jgi:adenylate cyclase
VTASEPDAVPEDPALLDAGNRFQAAMARVHARSRPGDLDALRTYAYVCTEAGLLDEALEADQALVAAAPGRADLHYDLACSLALLGKADEAFETLAKALELGFRDGEHMAEDDDLASLRGDPRFKALLAKASAR